MNNEADGWTPYEKWEFKAGEAGIGVGMLDAQVPDVHVYRCVRCP